MASVPSSTLSALVVLMVAASACGRSADHASAPGGDSSRDQVSCNVPRGEQSVCMEQLDPLDQTRRLSLVVQCTEGGGTVVESCPTRHLVGVCAVQQDTSRAWSLNAVTRIHHYVHPDVLSLETVETLAARCNGPARTWTPAATVAGTES